MEPGLSHLRHGSPCVKAARLPDYRPHYPSLEAVREAILWLIEHGQLAV